MTRAPNRFVRFPKPGASVGLPKGIVVAALRRQPPPIRAAPILLQSARVCVYDRPGRGWSDPVSIAQDGGAVAADLHTLLIRASVPGPFVLVGHSSGAQYVRIFGGRYPDQVAGMVLLNGQTADAFEGLPSSVPSYLRGVSDTGSFTRTSICPRPPARCSAFTTRRSVLCERVGRVR